MKLKKSYLGLLMAGSAMGLWPEAWGQEAAATKTLAAPVLLEPISVTATRSEKPVKDVPASVSVISSDEIEDHLVTDIKDLVRFEPGIAVRSSPSRFTAAGSSTGRDGNSGFNIRGLEDNRVLIQIDGIRVPDAFSFGPQAVGRGDYTDVGMLKSVEILRGPASALYGSDGVAGAVSFVTKDPEDLIRDGEALGLRAKLGYASADDSWEKAGIVAGRAGRWQGLVAYTRRDGHEQETQGANDSANASRTTANPEDVSSNSVLAKLLFDPNTIHRVRFTFDRFDLENDYNVLSAIAVPPLGATSVLGLLATDEIDRNRLSLSHDYHGGSFEARWAAYYQNSKTVEFSAEDRNTAPDRTRRSTFNNRVFGFNAQLDSFTDIWGIPNHFTYGGEVSWTRQGGIRDGTVPPVGESFPIRAFPITDYTLAGLFLQDEIELFGERLILYPAVRYDYYELNPKQDAFLVNLVPESQSDSHISPKFSAILKLTEDLNLFANYACGFKAPAPSQVNNAFSNLVANYRSVPNPNLKPETSETFEGGIKFDNGHFAGSLAAFTGEYEDFIELAQIGGTFSPVNPAIFQFVNLSDVEIYGIEAKADVELGRGFGAIAAFSYTRGISETNGVDSPLPAVEPYKLVAGMQYRDPDNQFGGQFIVTRSGGRDDGRAGGSVCAPNCFCSPDFTILDATAYWNVTPWSTLRIGLLNLTDETYWWWGDVRGQSATSAVLDAFTQPGRNVSISLVLRN